MRNFIILAQTNSMAKAAEKLHMTASPFGKSIAALEELVGYALFTRNEKSISLNKAGQELYQELFPIYQRLSAIDNTIVSLSHCLSGKKISLLALITPIPPSFSISYSASVISMMG